MGFVGELGSGKTTMIKAMVRYLTGQQATSPSFVILHEYPGKVPVYHFDFYRLKDERDLESTGWYDYLDKGIILVEWLDRLPECLPECTTVTLQVTGRWKREIRIQDLKPRRKRAKM